MPPTVQMIAGHGKHHWPAACQCTCSSISSSSSSSISSSSSFHCSRDTSASKVCVNVPILPSKCHRQHSAWPPPPPPPKSRSREASYTKHFLQPVTSTSSICVLRATSYLLHYACASLFLVLFLLALITGLYSHVTHFL